MMRWMLNVGVAAATALLANPVFAIEFGNLRPFQKGPVGDSPQYADFEEELSGEGGLELQRTWGQYKIDGVSSSKVSYGALSSRAVAGGAFAPNDEFAATAFADVTLGADGDLERSRSEPEATFDHGLYEHELSAMAVFKPDVFVLGGGLGVKMFGSESREFNYGEDRYVTKVSSAAMPVVRLFGGFMDDDFAATGGVRFFSMGEAVVEAEDAAGKDYEYDVVRRNPAEIHADGRIRLGDGDIGASLAYVLTGQASPQRDEFSMEFRQETERRRARLTGGDRRDTDHVRLSAGGRYRPVDEVAVQGSLSYKSPQYKEKEYASLMGQNLGGFRLDVGTDVRYERYRGFFHAGYLVDRRVSFTVPDDSRSEAHLQRTQRPPVREGDEIKMRQGRWSIKAGAGVTL